MAAGQEYEVVLFDGEDLDEAGNFVQVRRTVRFRKLDSGGLDAVYNAVRDRPGPADLNVVKEGLSRSVCEVNGTPVTYKQLREEPLVKRITEPKEINILRKVWGDVHFPNEAELAAAKATPI